MIPKVAFSPDLRTGVYKLFNGLGDVLAIAAAGFLAAGDLPTWFAVVLAVYGALSARVHALAGRNVTPPAQLHRRQP